MQLTDKSTISFEPNTKEELDSFFKENESKYHEIWIIITKKLIGNTQPVSFEEAIAEAMKYDLIDSRTKTLNQKKYGIRFTKRKMKKPHKFLQKSQNS